MSYALITGGGPDGRYTIEMDYGEATKAAILANLSVAQANLAAKRVQQQAIVDACDASELEARNNLIVFQEALIAEMNSHSGEVGDAAMKLYTDLLGRYRRLQALHLPARQALTTIKGQQAECDREIARYNNAVTSETKSAWCCDLTEDASGYVATIDIPGETNLMLIAPGGRAWNAQDGVFTAREIMSPEQAYFNVAILPGWQKFDPTYRWGTITSIDRNANTANVTLFDSTSSAQRLSVNQSSTLENVAFEYMDCHNRAFRDGDRVVVKFTGRIWAYPKIIGFLDNPRGCVWPCVIIYEPSVPAWPTYLFYTNSQSQFDKLFDTSATYDVRFSKNSTWRQFIRANTVPYDNYSQTSQQISFDYFYPWPDTHHPPLQDSQFDYGYHGNCSITATRKGTGLSTDIYLPANAVGSVRIFMAAEFNYTTLYGDDRVIAEFRVTLNGEVVFNAATQSLGVATTAIESNPDYPAYAQDVANVNGIRGPGAHYAFDPSFTGYKVLNDYVLFSES
jgi:hypothetical protein